MICLIALFLLIFLIHLGNVHITYSHHTIFTEDAEERILHLSDLHSCKFTEKLAQKIRREHPTLIVITGDLWDRKKKEIPRMIAFAETLRKICPVIYVPGNHEFHEPTHESIFTLLEKKDIAVLRHRILEIGGLQILGLDHLKYSAFTAQEFARLKKRNGFRIVAAHYPHFFEMSYVNSGADLVLCGHAHGGQFRIPFTHRGLYSPGQGIFPKYSEGIHEKNGVKMVISRGIGNSRFPFRLFNPPEIVIIDLERKPQ